MKNKTSRKERIWHIHEETEKEREGEKVSFFSIIQFLYQFCISFLFFILAAVVTYLILVSGPYGRLCSAQQMALYPRSLYSTSGAHWAARNPSGHPDLCVLCLHDLSWALQLWGRSQGSGCCSPSPCNHTQASSHFISSTHTYNLPLASDNPLPAALSFLHYHKQVADLTRSSLENPAQQSKPPTSSTTHLKSNQLFPQGEPHSVLCKVTEWMPSSDIRWLSEGSWFCSNALV